MRSYPISTHHSSSKNFTVIFDDNLNMKVIICKNVILKNSNITLIEILLILLYDSFTIQEKYFFKPYLNKFFDVNVSIS